MSEAELRNLIVFLDQYTNKIVKIGRVGDRLVIVEKEFDELNSFLLPPFTVRYSEHFLESEKHSDVTYKGYVLEQKVRISSDPDPLESDVSCLLTIKLTTRKALQDKEVEIDLSF